MPTYSYRCRCGRTQEQQQSMRNVASVWPCRCGRLARRTFTAPAVTFKGSGFYRTDSRSTE